MRPIVIGALGLVLGFAAPLRAQLRHPTPVPDAPRSVFPDPRAAADTLEAILARDSLDSEANWLAAMALVDVGKRSPDRGADRVRDSLYRVALRYAERAARLAPDLPDAHFAVATALGRASLTKRKTDRLKDAEAIRRAALRAIALDSTHDGAWHVLGRWHAELMRLSGIERFIARNFLGGRVVREASWEEATRCLERAVSLRPDWIYHRLDLAEVYRDRKRWADARQQLRAIATLPPRDALDPDYQRVAVELLQQLRDRK